MSARRVAIIGHPNRPEQVVRLRSDSDTTSVVDPGVRPPPHASAGAFQENWLLEDALAESPAGGRSAGCHRAPPKSGLRER